jgi:hypothetical protein
MKKYACLLFFGLLLNGCDDGDLTVDTIDFEDVTSISCDTTSTLIYKLKSQESLLLQLPSGSIKNIPTTIGDTLTYDIDNSSYRVVYRAYDGTVAKENICGIIPPKTPNVTEEWIGKSGKIVIATSAVYKSPAPEDGHTEITGYSHNIVFRNITFLKPQEQVEKEYIFGDYLSSVTPVVVTVPDETADYCSEQKKVYNNNLSNSLVLENFDAAALFINEDTPTGKPRTSLINAATTTTATLNNLYYRTYNGNLPTSPKDYYCVTLTPTTPTVKDTWVGETGVANVSGVIEVTTTHTNNVYKHTVVLKNAKLKKGNSIFNLATTFVLGTVTIVI